MKRYLKITEGSDCDLIAATIDAVMDGEMTVKKSYLLGALLRAVERNIEDCHNHIAECRNKSDQNFDLSEYGINQTLVDEAVGRLRERLKERLDDISYELSCSYMLQDEIQQILKDIQNGEKNEY